MKWFRDHRSRVLITAACGALVTCVSVGAVRPFVRVHALLFRPGAGLDRWIENVPGGSDVEKALFRAMQLPAGDVLFRRPPVETIPALTELQQTQKSAALYSLRALEEEQKLDFAAAERDWKSWAEQAEDRAGAHLDLAAFYERRLQPQAELSALEFVGGASPDARERWARAGAQRSWQAYERALKVVDAYALPHSESARIYAAWLKRYPQEPDVYARYFAFLLAEKDFAGADGAIARYRSAFPDDRIFLVKAEAELATRRGQPKDGLAVYEARFEPLWPAELIKSYFKLVVDSHSQRAFGDRLRASLAKDPDDLKTAARLFYLYQQQGQLDSAKAVLQHYRESKDERGAKWNAQELDTFEKLNESIQDFPEAARFAYALASDHGSPDSERQGMVALARILLTAPEQPLRVGAGNLALYKNIGTMDRGPGYLNGILSLLLNTQGPSSEYANEDRLATPYFHRARAAELLAQIDQRFPNEPARPQLHASLMEAYAAYGDSEAVIHEGTGILAAYPNYAGRVHVALELADAFERTRQTDKEFALYQELLKQLAAKAEGVPLGAAADAFSKPVAGEPMHVDAAPAADIANNATGAAESTTGEGNSPTAQPAAVRSAEYNEVLNRYLARLTALQRLPDALQVLRGELDRNPQDPGLYEKLADFLAQNRLNAHQEEVYQRAIQQFQDTGWYAKLARFYVRERRDADYAALMRKVADIFSGTELEEYLQSAPTPSQSLAMQVDLYAHERFPHDLRFADRLIAEYSRERNDAAVEKLLWEHWWESAELRDRLFGELSRTNRLDAQLALLREQAPEIRKGDWNALAARNPAAERLWMEACIWQSRYEDAVGASDSLSMAYPADSVLGGQASSLHRSLAYFHAEDTDKAIAVEKRMLDAAPGDLDTLARIGDIYADRERFRDAAPYWERMAEARPGDANGYLQSATVFWDYFDFASARAQLDKARTRLGQPTLFGYQQGAIDESRGDLPAAVRAYVASATADIASAESRDRLFALARRPSLRAQVEEGTAGLLKQANPSSNAVEVRAGILETMHRKDDLSRELKSVIGQTGSFDVLDAVTNAARGHALPDVEEAALRRQIILTTDPVRKLQLRYQLVDFLQQRDASIAAQEVDAIFREHGKILGVVRATVDYDWAHDRKQQAVSTLLQSAQNSYPELGNRFNLEAARKLTELGDFARSRTLLMTLLREKPLDALCEAAMAENLASAEDSAGLESFYRGQLELVRQAGLSHDEKQQRIGQLRRGVIAASTRLGKFNDAVEQYIELINAYPDDAALAQEAALYSVAHGARDRLFGFYLKTIAESPRDPRWSIVLARLATAADDDALAIDAYSKALKLRPERQDLYIAQASLDERLHQLDAAASLYRKLYTLSYRDPKWMEKVAELCARMGRNADAVKALETAWMEGRPAKASNSFAVAERLETWGLLDDAERFAVQGVDQAGPDLLVSEQSGAAVYARILARKRQADVALARLLAAREAAPKLTLSTVAQQVATQGPGAVTDNEWRRQRAEQRRDQAAGGLARALNALAGAVGKFYTPEEKMSFAALVKEHAAGAPAADLQSLYIPAARLAGLSELTAELEWTSAVERSKFGSANFSTRLQLQRQRVMLSTAAEQLEKIVPSSGREERAGLWRQVAVAYRDAGDAAGELRAMDHLNASAPLEEEELARYYGLLLSQRPDELARLAAREDSAAQYLVRNGSSTQALNAISARAAGRPAVWKDAYTALAGLYSREYRPAVRSAFVNALDADANIGERLANAADRKSHLAGDIWFYYGSRFGEYLDGTNDPRSEDYLESELEHTPGSAGAYLRLASYSNQAKRTGAALADYQHSLDLNGDQPAVLDSIATLQWEQGHRAEALSAWAGAVKQLAAEMDARRVPETFWSDFVRVLGSISAQGQYEAVRQQVDAMLRIYITRNGEYRTEPLLRAAYRANGKSVEWLLSVTASASNQRSVLTSILPEQWSAQAEWMGAHDLLRVRQRIVELAERAAQRNPGQHDFGLDSARREYARALLEQGQTAEADAVIARISPAERYGENWLDVTLEVADADGSLKQMLAAWTKQPDTAPADSLLRSASASLPAASVRAVYRFLYQRALDRRELTAPNFLGLATIELEENNIAGALQLLRSLTLASDNLYADTDAAARLLEDHGRPAESLEFLKPLVESSPWNAEYKVRLAKAMLGADPHAAAAISMLTSVAGDAKAEYAVRVAAAQALHGSGAPASGSEELVLLALRRCPSPESTSKPLFVAARVAAAECASQAEVKERLLHEALQAAPDDASVRLKYVFAAFDAKEDSRALIAAKNYLPAEYYFPDSAAPEEQSEGDTTGNRSSVTFGALSNSQALRLIRAAAAAYERRGDLKPALLLLKQGLRLASKGEDRTALENLDRKIKTELARMQLNEARAPEIHLDLDQGRVVQARLLPGMAVPQVELETEEQK